jgi:hypothetical protein
MIGRRIQARGGTWQGSQALGHLAKLTLATGIRQREIAARVLYRGKKAQNSVEFGQLKQLLRQWLRSGHP